MSPVRSQHLVGRRLDGWLTGWLAVALWIAAWVASRAGHPLGTLGVPVYWPAAVLSAMHFGMTYQLAYSGGAGAVRRRPFALAIGPLLLAAAMVVIVIVAAAGDVGDVDSMAQTAIMAVFLLTTWHYVKQVYGVVRIGARFAGVALSPREARVLRFGLYPMWFIGAATVLTRGAGTRYAGFRIGVDLLSPRLVDAAVVAGWCMAATIAVVVIVACQRARVRPPAMMVAPYVAAVLWLLAPVDYFTSAIALGALHALQYLACCYRASIGSGLPPMSRRSLLHWLEVFGGAACGGLLLTVWLPPLLDRRLSVGNAPSLFVGVFFVFLNLHHYLIDAVIWRSNGEVVRSMVAPPATARSSEAPLGIEPALA